MPLPAESRGLNRFGGHVNSTRIATRTFELPRSLMCMCMRPAFAMVTVR